jgi:hypothetical protein
MIDEATADEKTERMMEYRNKIFDAIPEDCIGEEMTISGLSVFIQAALHMLEHDMDKVQGLLDHVIELAQMMNKLDDEEGIWPMKTVH